MPSAITKHQAAGGEAKFQVQLERRQGLKCQTRLLGSATIPNSASAESRDSFESLMEKEKNPSRSYKRSGFVPLYPQRQRFSIRTSAIRACLDTRSVSLHVTIVLVRAGIWVSVLEGGIRVRLRGPVRTFTRLAIFHHGMLYHAFRERLPWPCISTLEAVVV